MKCKSCGKEVSDEATICQYCGFDLEAFKKLEKVIVQEDPDVDEKVKSNLVDTPILAFIFGVLSILSSLTFVVNDRIYILILALVVLFNFLTFKLANKPAKVKLKPFANVGKGMAYFSIAFIVLKVVFDIMGLLIK
ncbi:MAG: zinc ribbon domain-containing protein [Bacilli bacterium]